ncbi:hypothetical protein BC939DRAFT_505840 [Gamsiella multidivaricata]|uniref:uncharacterized protein n=1 Tax=Gamsiella multidivaricata TaxID=101098 RepID=UPI00221F5920|nr:uncharacterized protein BC939DRAFT_505840 [Gamsiella multidivaricata]KAG0370897.1 hypothetical protein BGZ54_003027 [Gamsiella multidivaricata]KAI7819329.1 hypothetical protein BC939DRAFT_505840 [Gamsiella multidivaricata]
MPKNKNKAREPPGTRAAINTTQSSTSVTRITSPVDLPEILSQVAKHLSPATLSRACQVSRLFHSVCAPQLWNTVYLQGETVNDIWKKHKGFRLGLIRYGRFVENLLLQLAELQDGDMELIAENCTRLKYLDLSRTNVTAETLKVLIHSDPYNTAPGSSKKRKRLTMGGSDDDDEEDDADKKMAKYRSMTETETEHEGDYLYESVGVAPSTSTESEQEQQRQHQPTGPVLPNAVATPSSKRYPTRSSSGRAPPPIARAVIPLHRRAGTARPAKFKGTKTQFPFHLEQLRLNRCNKMTGKSCLPVISRLGPQLKVLHLDHMSDLTSQDLIETMKHCPYLESIHMNGTDVTDKFLTALSSWSESNEQRSRRQIASLDVSMTNITNEGIVPLIWDSKDKMSILACQHNNHVNNVMLYAFVEDPAEPRARLEREQAKETPRTFTTVLGSFKRTFIPNSVLTVIQLSYCDRLTDDGFEALFRYATELQHIELDGCNLHDRSLLVLAETYRKRMERLGLGVPDAWHEHELGQRRVEAVKRLSNKEQVKIKADIINGLPEDYFKDLDSTLLPAPEAKVFSGQVVPGGLAALSLKHCRNITTVGVRAIVRCCVGLWGLNLSGCGKVRLQLFNGPWACLGLQDLNVSGVCLHAFDGVSDAANEESNLSHERSSSSLEAFADFIRFPPKPLDHDDYKLRYDFDEEGYYDFITPRDEEGSYKGKEKIEIECETDDEERKDLKKNGTKKTHRVTLPAQKHRNKYLDRVILRELFVKLGQMRQLKGLDMSNADYRIRVQDGLALVLPGLQQSLEIWNMSRYLGYNLHSREMKFFGKHFGYGHDFTQDQKELKRQQARAREYQGAAAGNDLNRVGKLESLMISKHALDGGSSVVYEWFIDQGIELDYDDDMDFMWMSGTYGGVQDFDFGFESD